MLLNLTAVPPSFRFVTQRAREKEEWEKEKAAKAAAIAERKAERERQKQANNARKSNQLSTQGKRKASHQLQPKTTKKRGTRDVRSRVVAYERSPTPPPVYNSRGRKIAPRRKFEAGK